MEGELHNLHWESPGDGDEEESCDEEEMEEKEDEKGKDDEKKRWKRWKRMQRVKYSQPSKRKARKQRERALFVLPNEEIADGGSVESLFFLESVHFIQSKMFYKYLLV